MKTILLAAAFMLSITFANAEDGVKSKRHKNVPKGKITYSEHKPKKSFAKKRVAKRHMFAGEGIRRNELTMFGKQERHRGDKR